MKRTLLLLTTLVALLASNAERSLAKDTWTKIQSKHFTVVGNANQKDMQKVMVRLEEFRELLVHRFSTLKIDSAVPTTVVIFKSSDSFRPFTPRYKGKTRDNVGGYFIPGRDANYVAMSTDNRGNTTYEVIFHEFLHFVMSNNLRNAPLWLNEGLAEFYSTFESRRNGQRFEVGYPIARHLHWLNEYRPIPLRTLLTVDRKSPYYNEGEKVGTFYAQSWALVHYLMIGNGGKRQQQLAQFITKISSPNELPLEQIFKQSFQADYDTIESELRAYVKNRSFPYMTLTPSKQFNVTSETVISPLTEAETEYHLGQLLVRLGESDEAEKRWQKSIASDATFVPSRVALGAQFLSQRRAEDARKLLKTAMELDPKNFLGHYYSAQLRMGEREAEEAVKHYEQAIRLQPAFTNSYLNLGYAYQALGDDYKAADAFARGLRVDPYQSNLQRAVGYLYLRLGEYRAAAVSGKNYLRLEGWQGDHSQYMALVVYFGQKHLKLDADAQQLLDQAKALAKQTDWPYPVFQYLRNELTLDKLLEQSTDNDKLTESHAYVGMRLLLEGDREGARKHFNWVKENGNRNFVEFPLALAELKRVEKATK